MQKQLAQHGRIVVASSGGLTVPGIRPGIQGPLQGGVASLAGGGGSKGLVNKGNMGGAATPAMLMGAANTANSSAKDKPRNTYYSSAVG